jgi:hypothetical protein
MIISTPKCYAGDQKLAYREIAAKNQQFVQNAPISHSPIPPSPRCSLSTSNPIPVPTHRCASTNSSSDNSQNPRVLAQPDKFRPPSHPARRVVPTRNGKVVNYPGPKFSEKEEAERAKKKYPNMFPPEGTVMFRFLTSRWIHVWIAFVRTHLPANSFLGWDVCD